MMLEDECVIVILVFLFVIGVMDKVIMFGKWFMYLLLKCVFFILNFMCLILIIICVNLL